MARMQNGRRQLRSTIFLVVSVLIVLFGGAMTLLWQVQHAQSTKADGGDMVGPPTLPAQTVNQILAGSPMAGLGTVIEQASIRTNVDDAFALGVWWTETNDGAAGVGLADRNPGSVQGGAVYPAAFDGYTIYPSYSAAVVDWFNLLHDRYVVGRGLTSAYTICYPYVGTASSYQWAVKVVNLMLTYRSEAPPPTPTPSPTPIAPTPNAVLVQHTKLHVIYQGPPTPGVPSRVPATTGTQSSVSAASTTGSPFTPLIILMGLLAGLLIALWGVSIKRSIPALVVAAVPAVAAVVPFPVSADAVMVPHSTKTPLPAWEPHTEQLSFEQTELQATQPVPVPVVANNPSFGGLLRRYADTDAFPRRVVLQPARVEPVSQVPDNNGPMSDAPGTLAVDPYRVPDMPEAVLPDRKPELVAAGARRLGLLSRYAQEKHDTEL